jgi:4-amino-4-deoxy-L-arabinose transferase-like glycosyltransferase
MSSNVSTSFSWRRLPSALFNLPRRLSMLQAIGCIVVFSILVKLSYILLFAGGLDSFPSEGSDAWFYESVARVLWKSGVYGRSPAYSTIEMPPGESIFLALTYAVSGGSLAIAKIAHITLLTLVAVLTFFTGKQMVDRVIGFWGGILMAMDPAQAWLSGTFLSEPLFIFFMILGIFFLIRQRDKPHSGWLIASGVCFGLAGLTRNQGWLFAFALVLGASLTRGRMLTVRAAIVVLVATMATIVPWTWRNYLASGQFVLVSSEGGLTLWASNNPEFVFRPPMPMALSIYDRPDGLTHTQIDQYFRERAIQWIIDHPIQFIVNGIRKIYVLYNFDPVSWRPEVSAFYRLAGLIPYGLLLPFIVFGIYINLRDIRWGVVFWYILFTTLLAAIFYGDSRIRAPIQPYLYLFGSVGLEACLSWCYKRGETA